MRLSTDEAQFDFRLGVLIAKRKHPVPYRTRQLSSSAAKVVLGRLSVRIAQRAHYIKKDPKGSFFFAYFFVVSGADAWLRPCILDSSFTNLSCCLL